MAGKWSDRESGYLTVINADANRAAGAPVLYQDPYRKQVLAKSMPLLRDISNKITAKMVEGLDRSEVVVLTLGLTEVWRHNDTGKCFARPPGLGYGGEDKATFHCSTFAENYDNVRAIIDIILERAPSKYIVISVSPVRLQKTYAGIDVSNANWESKSTLRAVAGQVCREYGDRVTYFPSYEMAMLDLGASIGLGDVFEEDVVHVRPDFVKKVIGAFRESYSA